VLAKSWKPYLAQTNIVLEDAACYESYMRFPTNIKLLWESVDWMYGQLKITCKRLKIPTPRTKYLEQRDKHFAYMRMRKKPWKLTVKRTRSLLYLLEKLIHQQKKIEDQCRIYLEFPEKYYHRRRVISKVLKQKTEMLTTDDIYATNANRKWCTEHKITTNFKRKDRAGKYEDQRQIVAAELRKERATRMEGSFGTEKQHYSLDKIKARIENNEILWIFLGVHTANAVKIAKRLAQEKLTKSVA
jgi:hypothetical protein